MYTNCQLRTRLGHIESIGFSNRSKVCSASNKMSDSQETHFAVFGAGWFWKPQKHFDKILGVVSTRVGYTGGQGEKRPSYKSVCGGDGHTEAILIEYDPTVVDFESLLGEFFRMHDPLKKQQTQYSSAIFACDENQMEIAKRECYQLAQLLWSLWHLGPMQKRSTKSIWRRGRFWNDGGRKIILPASFSLAIQVDTDPFQYGMYEYEWRTNCWKTYLIWQQWFWYIQTNMHMRQSVQIFELEEV